MKGRIKIISVLLIISLLSIQCVVVKKNKDIDKKALNEKEKLDYKINTKFFYKLDMDEKYSTATKDFSEKDTVYARVSITGIDETKNKTGNIKTGALIGLIIGAIICFAIFIFAFILYVFIPVILIVSTIIFSLIGFAIPVDISNNSKVEKIEANLYIPNTAGVSSTFYDGKMVESENQDGNTIYKLPIEVQKKEGKENIFIFQIKSEKSADVPIKLIFDEPLTHYNTQSTIRFLE